MACLSHRVGLFLQRHAFRQRCAHVPQQQSRLVSVNINTKTPNHEPTTSQILRFTLTGTTKPPTQDISKADLDGHLKEIFEGEWPSSAIPPPLWSSLHSKITPVDKEVFFKGLKHDVRNLRHLQTFIERHVNGDHACSLLQSNYCQPFAKALERCHRQHSAGEILAVLNAIISRLQKMRVPISSDLYALGLHYSCLAYSATAIERHVQGYLDVSYQRLDLDSSVSLVDALNASLQSFELKGESLNTTSMLTQVTGESNDGSNLRYTLHTVLSWADPRRSIKSIDRYFSLLVKLGSTELLQDMWNRVLRRLSLKSQEHDFHIAYTCVLALINNGNPTMAARYLQQISEYSSGTLPYISGYKDLNAFLAEPEIYESLPELTGKKEYIEILHIALEQVERRLGINWVCGKEHHTKASDAGCIATKQPLLTMDGEHAGYGSTERLLTEIQALGRPTTSLADFQRIVHALDDHDDGQIPVILSLARGISLEFAWIPHRCPIEFRNLSTERTGDSVSLSPSTMGLLRVDPPNAGLSSADSRSLHLMQLGSLVMRSKPSSGKHPIDALEWKESGYIAALNRASGQLLAVFVGNSRGRISSDIQSLPSQSPPDLNSIMVFDVCYDGYEPLGWNYSPVPDIDMKKCYVGIDPCPDLVP